MVDRPPGVMGIPGLTAWRVTFLVYALGYLIWVARAMYWGATHEVDRYWEGVAWHVFLYGPMWPLMLLSRITGMVISTV
jgi:hypothetical protein